MVTFAKRLKNNRAALLIIACWISAVVLFLSSWGTLNIADTTTLSSKPEEKHDPSEYTFIIIHYHKTGHDISNGIYELIRQEGRKTKTLVSTVKGTRSIAYKKRDHDKTSKCPKFKRISPGIIFVQTAPDFYCSVEKLKDILQPAQDYRNNTKNRRHRGIKIIHMIRNPFDMAISNYFYHSQIPTPEEWVNRARPCEYHYHLPANKESNEIVDDEDSIKSLILPALTEIPPRQFDKAYLLCRSLFQNRSASALTVNGTSLDKASFYDHLLNLNQKDGLRLATAQMILSSGLVFPSSKDITDNQLRNDGKTSLTETSKRKNLGRDYYTQKKQTMLKKMKKDGRKAGADILRMGNNLRKLKELQEFLKTDTSSLDLQILSMDMAHWISSPFNSTMRVLDFVFGDNIPHVRKQQIAFLYNDAYQRKVEDDSQHITSGKSYGKEEKAALASMLRFDESLGPILTAVEKLVDEALV